MSVFASAYAGWYDTLYREKDYPGECDYLELAFGRLGVSPKTIIDLGCGTGGHSLLLAQRGYNMTAVDRSAAMLQAARTKADRAGVTVDFHQLDVVRLEWREAFDAAISMFAVVGYQCGDGELEAMLAGVFRSLRPGGVFIFDGWHGSGVLRERPLPRLLEIPLDNEEVILRLADPRLDAVAQIVEVHYRLWHRRGATIIAESEERHLMRYFFSRELHCLLRQAGFTAVSIHPFCEIDKPLQEQHWHFMAIAGKEK